MPILVIFVVNPHHFHLVVPKHIVHTSHSLKKIRIGASYTITLFPRNSNCDPNNKNIFVITDTDLLLRPMSTMLEIGPRSRILKKELINCVDHVTKIVQMWFVNFFSIWDLGLISSIVDIGLYSHWVILVRVELLKKYPCDER